MIRHADEPTPQRKLERLHLPEPLEPPAPIGLPDPIELPDGIELPDPIELPDGIELPDPIELPAPLAVTMEAEPHVPAARDPLPAPPPEPPPVIPLPVTRTPNTPQVNRPPTATPPVQKPSGLTAGGRTKGGPNGRKRSIPAPVWFLVVAVTVITLLSSGHHAPPQAITPAPISGAPAHAAPTYAPTPATGSLTVGMPIPTGDAPEQPIRIVLEISEHEIPTTERRTLGAWIERTQNSKTRIRIQDHGHLSHAVTGAELVQALPPAITSNSAIDWLKQGVREHRAGALVRIGDVGSSVMLARGIRETEVSARTAVLRVHHRLAAAIAREIMVTSQQGYGGTTAP